MTASEASADLEQLFGYVRTFYGPYDYKEARFGYSIAELEEQARDMLADEPTDDGFYTAANWFLSRFDDGHVGLTPAPSSNPVTGYSIPLFITPVEGKALVAAVGSPLVNLGIAYGDEVVSIDGISPFTLVDTEIRKVGAFGNPLSNQHLIYQALLRPGYAAGLRPTSPTAHLDFRRADGSEYSLDLIWREVRDESPSFVPEGVAPLEPESYLSARALAINAAAQGSLLAVGSPTPFFYNGVTRAVFDITPVVPNAEMLARYAVDPAAPPGIFGALYSYGGKSLLLIRQSIYGDATELGYYRALLDQYDNFVDGLVVDQTHNPGGSVQYCTDFARLFTSSAGANFVQAYNADRKWVNDLRDAVELADPDLTTEEALRFELLAARIEQAYDAGQALTAPLPLFGGNQLLPDDQYVWTKPLLVLIDELAGSCADVFPMLIKSNRVAPLFGRRTMGLGGNVEGFGPLTNSLATLSLTRGIFTAYQEDETYAPADFVENNGVQPDVEHVITAADFRSGFIDYMAHFSAVIAAQIDGATIADQSDSAVIVDPIDGGEADEADSPE